MNEKNYDSAETAAQVAAREAFEREHGSVSTEMPRYKCHKVVHALKIQALVNPTKPGNESDGSLIIVPAEDGFAPFRVKHEYVHKHKPIAGGYYVVYEDGYASFSPAKAFEEGYTRL